MELLPPILPQAFYTTFEELISAVNIFATTGRYIVVKKQTKKSKKVVLRKAVLIYDRSKTHVDVKRFGRNITLRKYDCPLDAITFTKDNIWVLQVGEAGYNHEYILLGSYLTHRNVAMTPDIQHQIAYQAYVGVSLKQILSILRFDNDKENLLLKHKTYTIFGEKSRKKT